MTILRCLLFFTILATVSLISTDAQNTCWNGIELQVYGSQGNYEPFSCQNGANLTKSANFIPGHDTVVIVIDYFGNNNNRNEYKNLKTKLLSTNNVNVVVMNYTSLASNKSYVAVDLQTPCMAQCLGEFMQTLTDSVGQNRDKIHLIGVGLGARIISSSATVYTDDGRVVYRRVTALDPYGPTSTTTFFTLNTTCADYVQIIATNQGLAAKPIVVGPGTIVFYPDLGTTQYPCPITDLLCPHMISISYFTESMTNVDGFLGKSCTAACQNALPNGITTLACTCTENFAYMGYSGDYDKKTGSYFFCPRNNLSPGNYGLGKAGVAFANPTKPCCPPATPVVGQLTCPGPIMPFGG